MMDIISVVDISLMITNIPVFANGQAMKFMYEAQVVIQMILPSVGPVAGGSRVSISGSNFPLVSSLSCVFGTQRSDAQLLSSTLLLCHSPPSDASSKTVSLLLSQDHFAISSGKEAFVYQKMQFFLVYLLRIVLKVVAR